MNVADRFNPGSTALLVAGVHRSGTSVITRLINLLGAELPGNLMPVDDQENAKGFWESVDIADFNDELLRNAQSSWDDVLPVDFNLIDTGKIDYLSNKADCLLGQHFCNSSFFVIKDPRFSRILPFWLPLLKRNSIKTKILIPYRHPHEVAASLNKRNGFSLHKGIYLWLRNSVDVIRHTSEVQRTFFSYSDVMDNWLNTVKKIEHDIDVKWPVEPESIFNEVSNYLDQQLRHFDINISIDPKDIYEELAMQLYFALRHKNGDLQILSESIHHKLTTIEEPLIPFIRGEVNAIANEREKWWQITGDLRGKLESTAAVKNIPDNVTSPQEKDYSFDQLKNLEHFLYNEFGTEERDRVSSGFQLFKLSPLTHPKFEPNSDEILRNLISLVTEKSSHLPVSESPDVSIIIPIFNQLEHTLACIYSILDHTTKYTFNIIIADDCSSQTISSLLQNIPNVQLHRNETNLGFIKNCNRSAATANSEFIVLLNNDTFVLAGWLDNLLDTFKSNPNIGLVGSKLIYPDGKLQESGAFIFSDGSGWNYGRNDNPCKPQYCYLRDSDYVSGASIAIRKSLWETLHGFDEIYDIAYYEDTDLAFRVRDAGFRVVVQPQSQLIHFEGVSSGTDLERGVKHYQFLNSKKFKIRWENQLTLYGEAVADNLPIHRNCRTKILVIDARIPTPDQDSGSLDTFNFLRILNSLGAHVTFVPSDIAFSAQSPHYTHRLQSIGIEVLYSPFVADVTQVLAKTGSSYDYILVYRAQVASQFYEQLRQFAPQAKLIYDTVDLHFLRMEREAQLSSDGEKQSLANEMKVLELELIEKFDATILLSTYETELIKSLTPKSRVYTIPICRDIPDYSNVTFNERKDIVFIGGFEHHPNIDAVLWFVKEVLPLLKVGGFKGQLIIAGSKLPKAISSLAQPGIIIRGFVSDLRELFSKVRISVAPLRFGAGIKGKIVTSLSYSVPVVATTIAAEGCEFKFGESILISDTPELMAKSILDLYSDPILWSNLSKNGYDHCKFNYSINEVAKKLLNILKDLKPEIFSDFDDKLLDIENSNFLNNDYSSNSHSKFNLVKNIYKGFLNCSPSFNTIQNWVHQLDNGLEIESFVESILDLDDFRSKYNRFNSKNWIQLFYDTGNGFLEKDSIRFAFDINDDLQEFVFILQDLGPINSIRIDPLNNSSVLCIEEIILVTSKGSCSLSNKIESNACAVDNNTFYFETADPQIYFTNISNHILNGVKELTVKVRYLHTGHYAELLSKQYALDFNEPDISKIEKKLMEIQENVSKQSSMNDLIKNFFSILREDFLTAANSHSEMEHQLNKKFEEKLDSIRKDSDTKLASLFDQEQRQLEMYKHMNESIKNEISASNSIEFNNIHKRFSEHNIELDALKNDLNQLINNMNGQLNIITDKIETYNSELKTIYNWKGFKIIEKLNSR